MRVCAASTLLARDEDATTVAIRLPCRICDGIGAVNSPPAARRACVAVIASPDPRDGSLLGTGHDATRHEKLYAIAWHLDPSRPPRTPPQGAHFCAAYRSVGKNPQLSLDIGGWGPFHRKHSTVRSKKSGAICLPTAPRSIVRRWNHGAAGVVSSDDFPYIMVIRVVHTNAVAEYLPRHQPPWYVTMPQKRRDGSPPESGSHRRSVPRDRGFLV